MGTSDQLLNWARAQVGTTSGRTYWKQVYGYESNLDWCAVFCSAALKATGTSCVYFPSTFAFDKRDLGVIGNRWVEPYDLKAGDPISFDFDGGGQWGGDHVGIVDAVLGPGYYRTIEGNVSSRCEYRWRRVERDGIIGGIRPKYDGATAYFRRLNVDCKWGPNTCKSLQTTLQIRKHYLGYDVDGDWGYYTRYELQLYLKSTGVYSRNLDGDFGYYSTLAMQTRLRGIGTFLGSWRLDGKWGPKTTKALQEALNAHAF